MDSYPRIRYWLLLIIITLSIQSCFADVTASGNSREVTVTGVLKKQGITAYMYGDFVLVDSKGKTVCAIRQGKTDLNAYVGRSVTIKGMAIKGYPVDFGPPYIGVNSISFEAKQRSKSP